MFCKSRDEEYWLSKGFSPLVSKTFAILGKMREGDAMEQKAYSRLEVLLHNESYSIDVICNAILSNIEAFYAERAAGRNCFDDEDSIFYEEHYESKDDLCFIIENHTAALLSSDNRSCSVLLVPESVNGYPVRRIADQAFESCDALQSVSIPEGITDIGDYSFRNCKNLERVSLPDSIETIGAYAFEGCTRLNTINIPDGVTHIGRKAFRYCGLKEITIPDTVKVGADAFLGIHVIRRRPVSPASSEKES